MPHSATNQAANKLLRKHFNQRDQAPLLEKANMLGVNFQDDAFCISYIQPTGNPAAPNRMKTLAFPRNQADVVTRTAVIANQLNSAETPQDTIPASKEEPVNPWEDSVSMLMFNDTPITVTLHQPQVALSYGPLAPGIAAAPKPAQNPPPAPTPAAPDAEMKPEEPVSEK